MPLPTSLYRGFGDQKFPLTTDDLVSTNVIPDPPRDMMLELFATAFNDEMTDVWPTVASGTSLEGIDPVKTKIPFEPTARTFQQWKAGLPVVAVHRQGVAQYSEHTLTYDHRVQQWGVHYILKTLQLDHLRRFEAAPLWFANTVDLCIRKKGHLSYESGALQFGTDKGGLEYIKLVSHQLGQAQFADDDSALFMAASLVIETGELENLDTEQWTEFAGADWELGVGDGQGGVIQNLLYLNSDYPPQ